MHVCIYVRMGIPHVGVPHLAHSPI